MPRHLNLPARTFWRSLMVTSAKAVVVLVAFSLGVAAAAVLTRDRPADVPTVATADGTEPGEASATTAAAPPDPAPAATNGPGPTAPPTSAATPTLTPGPAAATPALTPGPAAATPALTPGPAAATPALTPGPPAGDPTPVPDPPPVAGVTVQVLDGGAGQARTQAVAQRLRELGYRVVAINQARCCYDRTTVLHTRGNLAHAEGLRHRDPRFGAIRPNPNLSESVTFHVVAGRDWSG